MSAWLFLGERSMKLGAPVDRLRDIGQELALLWHFVVGMSFALLKLNVCYFVMRTAIDLATT